MSLHHSPKIVTNGLVLCLDAGNRKSYSGSGTVWKDLAGNNNGTLTNGPTFNSANGGSIVFDGINDYSTFGNLSLFDFGTNPFSISFWIYPTAWNDGTSRGIIDKKSNDGTNGWTIYNDGAGGRSLKINARLGLQNNFPSITSVLINGWQNWTFTRNANFIQSWYYNGILDTTGVSNNTNLTDTAVLDVARSKTWGGYFKGNFSICLVYNKELIASEVLQNYNALKGRFNL